MHITKKNTEKERERKRKRIKETGRREENKMRTLDLSKLNYCLNEFGYLRGVWSDINKCRRLVDI